MRSCLPMFRTNSERSASFPLYAKIALCCPNQNKSSLKIKIKNTQKTQLHLVYFTVQMNLSPMGNQSTFFPFGKSEQLFSPMGNQSNLFPMGNESNFFPMGNQSSFFPMGNQSNLFSFGKSEQLFPYGKSEQLLPYGKSEQLFLPMGNQSSFFPMGNQSRAAFSLWEIRAGKSEQLLPYVKSEQLFPYVKQSSFSPCEIRAAFSLCEIRAGKSEQLFPYVKSEQLFPYVKSEQGNQSSFFPMWNQSSFPWERKCWLTLDNQLGPGGGCAGHVDSRALEPGRVAHWGVGHVQRGTAAGRVNPEITSSALFGSVL